MQTGFTILRSQEISGVPSDPPPGKLLQWAETDSSFVWRCYAQSYPNVSDDQLFAETEHYIFGLDGIVLNLDLLCQTYATANWELLFLELYERHGAGMAEVLYGTFCGFVIDKRHQALLCFTDHCSAKKVFYYHAKDLLVISGSLRQVSACLSASKKTLSLDYRSAYALLTAGGMYGHHTLMEQVYRLHGGQYAELRKDHFYLGRYFDYNNIPIVERPEAEIIDELEDQFQAALQLEYQKDKAFQKQHLATLSGGLDSRMNVGLAYKAGYQVHNLCFSQSTYADAIIAAQIAEDLHQTLDFVPLDQGAYIFDLEENMHIYEGTIFYLSSAHFNYAIQKIDTKPYGLIHSGLLGDAILGTYISAPRRRAPDVIGKLQSRLLLPKIHSDLKKLAQHFVSEDAYNLHMRFFNVIISGSYAMEKHGFLCSPFMEPGFMRTCLSMPPRYKFQQRIYIKWLNRYHPELNKYTWETTGFRPRFTWQNELSRFTLKAKHLYYGARNQQYKLTMTPYEHWYQNNPKIAPFLKEQFEKRIHLLDGAAELQADVRRLYAEGNVIEKSHAITLLAGMQLLNLKT